MGGVRDGVRGVGSERSGELEARSGEREEVE